MGLPLKVGPIAGRPTPLVDALRRPEARLMVSLIELAAVEVGPVFVDLLAMRRPLQWQNRSLALDASIGIILPADSRAVPPAQIFADADVALYAAKKAGRNTVRTSDSFETWHGPTLAVA